MYFIVVGSMTKRKSGRAKPRDEIIVKPKYQYEDGRGRIDYHVLPEPVTWIGTITTKRGSIRANHYHPVQEQKLLLVSGKCISIYKDISVPGHPIRHHIVQAGDLVITPNNIAHAVVYLEDCTQINLVKGERIPDNYGKHTIPYQLVKPEDIDYYISLYR